MPTFYTENLYDGKGETLRSFILRCAVTTAAGCRATHNGEELLPIDKPPVLTCGDYHQKELEKAQKTLDFYTSHTPSDPEVVEAYNHEKTETAKNWDEYRKEIEEIRTRYTKMMELVDCIEFPPQYSYLSDMMHKQLSDSLEHDCILREDSEFPTIDKWVKASIVSAEWLVDYHTKELTEEQERVRHDNEYLKGLYDFLDTIAPYQETT